MLRGTESNLAWLSLAMNQAIYWIIWEMALLISKSTQCYLYLSLSLSVLNPVVLFWIHICNYEECTHFFGSFLQSNGFWVGKAQSRIFLVIKYWQSNEYNK